MLEDIEYSIINKANMNNSTSSSSQSKTEQRL